MPIINTLSASSIRKRLPSRVITAQAISAEPLESWLYDDGNGDPWWQGAGATAYRWTLTATVDIVNHSSHLSREPFQYSGLDITPGMWVMATTDSRAVRVISIITKDANSITCVVEDVDRYNTFSDQSGTGAGIFITPNPLIFFQLGDDGLPVLTPLPLGTDLTMVSQVEARFRVLNPVVEHRFFQLSHGFKEGQVLRLNPSTGFFEQATSDDIYMVGTVTSVGPGPNFFYLSPTTKIIQDLEPGLSGTAGDIIWLDTTTGDRTTNPSGSNVPVYVQMTNAQPSFVIGSVDDPQVWGQNQVKVNGSVVTMGGTAAMVGASTILNAFNTTTASHGVVASMSAPATEIVSTNTYPSATPSSSLQFKLNGIDIIITPPSINFGTSGDIGFWDVIRAVNEQTHRHGVSAKINVFNGFMTFTNESGGSIDFTNIQPTVTTGGDKTITDMLGVAESNAPGIATRIKLSRPDGGEIIISNVNGDVLGALGVQSVANGSLPLALVVDKTMIANSNYVVADIAARDALTGLRTGDQVYVQSSYDGEWALFVKTSTDWTKIADYDSSNTDAKSLSATVNFSSTSPISLGNISDGTRVVDVTVIVTTPFNDAGVTISVGYPTAQEAVMVAANVDPTQAATYENSTSYVNTSGNEQELFIYFNPGTATAGQAKVIISYL